MADPDETQLTEGGIATDETLEHDAAARSNEGTGPRIRASKRSIPPSKLGRYTIVRPLGRGGMGAVLEADDPELGRRVAIKVLRDDRLDPKFAEDLRREAQALARLVHPNVVTVHDVGIADGQVFVVMQLVTGDSIDRWLRARGARTSEIVAAFRQAGRGLSAAHAAKLVHCDFKPGNVLVDRDGVVRVTDFGLVRIGAELDHSDSGKSMPIAGTPAYMAPEQFDGIATAESDQYAFCVALWELLAGERPFADTSLDTNFGTRVLRPLPRGIRIPKYISRALVRGLATDPAQRFPSMDVLVEALATPRRGWFVVGGAGVVAAAAITVLAVTRPPTSEHEVIVEPDLENVRRLTQYGSTACAYAPTVVADGVVFDRTKGDDVDLYEVPLSGGEPRQLTTAPTWEWRSNPGRNPGEVIHQVHDTKDIDKTHIAFLDLATGKETMAADVYAIDAALTNGGIVYVERGATALRRLSGTADTVLATPPAGAAFGQLAVSHRGDRVAVASSGEATATALCVIDVTSGLADCARTEAGGERTAFGADDRGLYFASRAGILRRDLASGISSFVIPNVVALGGMSVTPDGSALVYSDCAIHSQIVDWSEHPPRPFVNDPFSSQASLSNGGTVAWVRAINATKVLMVRGSDGVELQLTDVDFGSISSPTLSPDGLRVAFRGNSMHPGIWVTPTELTPTRQQLTFDDVYALPVWLDNGQLALTKFADPKNPIVVIVSRDGGNVRRVGNSSRTVVGAHQGKLLVAGAEKVYWLDPTTNLEQPGPEVPVHGEIKSMALSPDGHWLLYQGGGENQQIWRQALEPPGPLEELPALAGGQTVGVGAISNEGHVIIAPQTWSGDLYLVPAKPGTRF